VPVTECRKLRTRVSESGSRCRSSAHRVLMETALRTSRLHTTHVDSPFCMCGRNANTPRDAHICILAYNSGRNVLLRCTLDSLVQPLAGLGQKHEQLCFHVTGLDWVSLRSATWLSYTLATSTSIQTRCYNTPVSC